MGKARNFKFSVQIERHAHKPKNAKVGQKGHDLPNVTYYYNFGTPLYRWNGQKLETSNLVFLKR